MAMTINISLPKSIYNDAKKMLATRGYASMSELVRDALRRVIRDEEITENGFPRRFEDQVLEAAKEPVSDEVWKTEEDVDKFFKKLHKDLENKRHAKG